MAWQFHRNLAFVFVVLSIITEAIIVAYDGYLAQVGGTLATLEGVVAVQIILAILLFARPSWGLTLTLVLSALWLLGQLANAFSSGPPGVTFPQGFIGYIFGYGAISPNAAAGCPYGCPPFGYSALVSIVLQVPVTLFAFSGRSALKRSKTPKPAAATT